MLIITLQTNLNQMDCVEGCEWVSVGENQSLVYGWEIGLCLERQND